MLQLNKETHTLLKSYCEEHGFKMSSLVDKLIKKGSYTEGSKWYKANILLSKGNKDDAVKILKQLTSSTSVFKERAIKKLEEIEAE